MCPALVDNGYCEQHQPRYQDRRESASKRGYDAYWRKVRKQHLRANPLCADCLTENIVKAAQEVHHTIRVKDDPSRRLDRSILMSLCTTHHRIRTARGE